MLFLDSEVFGWVSWLYLGVTIILMISAIAFRKVGSVETRTDYFLKANPANLITALWMAVLLPFHFKSLPLQTLSVIVSNLILSVIFVLESKAFYGESSESLRSFAGRSLDSLLSDRSLLLTLAVVML